MSEGSDVKPYMEGKRNLASFLTGDEQTIQTYQILGHGKSNSNVHPTRNYFTLKKKELYFNCICCSLIDS